MRCKYDLISEGILNTESLCNALSVLPDPPSAIVLETCDSTNDEAKRRAASGAVTSLVIAANEQTAGRGRLGRSFFSPAQTGLYFSILYRVSAPLSGMVSLTGACAVAVMRAIRTLTGIQTEIKWVNDLYLEGKKVCGILAEAVSMGENTHLIVGIGINLSTETFPDELCHKAGSLACTEISRAALIAEIFRELIPFFNDPSDRTWISDYRSYSMVIGKEIVWGSGDEHHTGVAVGINGDGELEVRSDAGEVLCLRTGEISVKVRSR